MYGVILGSDLLVKELATAEGWNFSSSAIRMLAMALLLLVDKQIDLPAQWKSHVDEKVGIL